MATPRKASRKEPAYIRAGFSTQNAYTKANRASAKWSNESSRDSSTRWDPKFTPEQKGEYFRLLVSAGRPKTKNIFRRKLGKFNIAVGRETEESWAVRYPQL